MDERLWNMASKDPSQIITELKQFGGCIIKRVGKPESYLGGIIVRTKDSEGKRKTSYIAFQNIHQKYM